MRFSLRLNNDLAVAEYIAIAQAAEASGFDQIWVSNDLFLRSAPVICRPWPTPRSASRSARGFSTPHNPPGRDCHVGGHDG